MNHWQGSQAQAQLIFRSYAQLFGKPLMALACDDNVLEKMYFANFAILSHGTQDDPIFNFANAVALKKFELTWSQMAQLPSRLSAEAPNQQERKVLLDRVRQYGFIDDYQGVRISSTGKRFIIRHAHVWNLVDDAGIYRGQAAAFSASEDVNEG